MAGKKRKCFICGKEYTYCPVCEQDKDKPTYLFLFCSDKCNQINDIISKYEFGKLDIKKAKSMLEKIDINNINIISKSNKVLIEKILTYKDNEELNSAKKKSAKKNTTQILDHKFEDIIIEAPEIIISSNDEKE